MPIACPSCRNPVPTDDAFCPACGHKVRSTGAELDAAIAHELAEKRLAKARKWLIFVAILTWIGGAITYVMQTSEVDRQLADFDRQIASIPAGARDQLLKDKVGMTYDEIVAHDRGQVTMMVAINVGLGFVYLALWVWARRNAVTASIVALLLFVTVHAVNAFISPLTIVQGIIVKIAVIGALIAAIRAALEARRAAARASVVVEPGPTNAVA
jgi:hypothetical protein